MLWTSDEFGAALQLGTLYLAYGLRVTLANGSVAAFTNIRRKVTLATLTIPIRPGKTVTVPGATYDHRASMRVTNAQFSDDVGQTDNMEATLSFGPALSEAAVRAGKFDNRPFDLVVFDWKKPLGDDGVPRAMLRMRGDLGARTIQGRDVTWKLRSLANRLRGDILETTSRDSVARWEDPELSQFNLNGNTHDGFAAQINTTVAEVDASFPRRRFRLTGMPAYPDDRFSGGMAYFQGGANDGFSSGLLQHEPATGWVATTRNAPKPITVGAQIGIRIRPPRTFEEWLTYFGAGKFFPAQPEIPTVESANRVTN
jgi:hypothetical protein